MIMTYEPAYAVPPEETPIAQADPPPKREPVVVVMSILAGLTALVSGAAGVAELQGMGWLVPWIALVGLIVSAATTGVQFWVRGQVTPVD
jgi:hypothetical protein